MTKFGPFFSQYGITTYCFHDFQGGEMKNVAYYWDTGIKQQAPASYSPSASTIQAIWSNVYLKLGLRVFNADVGTSQDVFIKQLSSASPPAAFLYSILSPWGYGVQDSNLASQYPSLAEYHLVQNTTTLQYSLIAANGIVCDNQQPIIAGAQKKIDTFLTNNPKGIIGVHDADLSDHPINYGKYPYSPPSGYTYLSSGHNVQSYSRFIQTQDYLVSVNSSGNHVSDGTPCAIWAISSTATLTPQMAYDVYQYHFPKANFGGNSNNYPSGNYGHYLALNFAMEEVSARNYMSSKIGGSSLFHNTLLKSQLGSQIANFPDILSYHFGATVNANNVPPNPDLWFGTIIRLGGTGSIPSFADTWAATSPTGDTYLYQYFLQVLPLVGNLPVTGWLENVGGLYLGTTYIPEMLEAVGLTTPWGQGQGAGVWPHFGTELLKIPYLGGWFGFENDTFRLLAVAHHVGSTYTYQPLYNVARLWGADPNGLSLSSSSLSSFDVLFIDLKDWFNPASSFWPTVQSWVQAGGKLVVNSDGAWNNISSFPTLMQLAGVTGVTSGTKGSLIVNQPSHPILAPYGSGILPTYSSPQTSKLTVTSTVKPIVSDSNLGPVIWENAYGSGKVVMMGGPSTYTNNFNTGPTAGYYWLVVNALIYAAGLKPPAIYFPSYRITQPLTGIYFSVYGTKGNILVWLSNSNTTSAPAAILLSSQFYGLPSAWSAQNVLGGLGFSGSGDVDLSSYTLPAQEWAPIVISSGGPAPTQGQLTYKIIGAVAALAIVSGLIVGITRIGKNLLMRLRRPRVSRLSGFLPGRARSALKNRHTSPSGHVK